MTELSPAILTNDVSDFRKKYADLLILANQGYFNKLHIDFIDGEFLPSKTLMPEDLSFLDSDLVLFAHFMTLVPQKYFEQIMKLGFNTAVIHYEAFDNDKEIIEAITEGKRLGLRMGLAINPETPLNKIAKVLPNLDVIQVMGIHPGAQGREFIPETVDRINELKSLTRSAIISVDGGINLTNIAKLADTKVDVIIVGSAILHAAHPKEALEALKREIELKR